MAMAFYKSERLDGTDHQSAVKMAVQIRSVDSLPHTNHWARVTVSLVTSRRLAQRSAPDAHTTNVHFPITSAKQP